MRRNRRSVVPVASLAIHLSACASHERAPIPEPRPVQPVEPAPRPVRPVDPAPVQPEATAPAPVPLPEPVSREMFPGVRLVRDVDGRQFVEVDGFVPIMDDPQAPDVYLELIMCRRDTRDHEVLVATDAKASHIHAALLLLGLSEGHPGRWHVENRRLIPEPPEGDAVTVEFVWEQGGETMTAHPSEWVKNLADGTRLPRGEWLFAGSVETDHPVFPYGADGSGNVVGLTTFGDEVLAYPTVISPEAAIDEPVWGADFDHVPPFGTAVVVRLIPVTGGP
ncbi:MAG: hypothetical protein KDA21_15275 [Phycisphaerales bacterium]|nr:hypothetical protein [Phycisphaerales bacterium]